MRLLLTYSRVSERRIRSFCSFFKQPLANENRHLSKSCTTIVKHIYARTTHILWRTCSQLEVIQLVTDQQHKEHQYIHYGPLANFLIQQLKDTTMKLQRAFRSVLEPHSYPLNFNTFDSIYVVTFLVSCKILRILWGSWVNILCILCHLHSFRLSSWLVTKLNQSHEHGQTKSPDENVEDSRYVAQTEGTGLLLQMCVERPVRGEVEKGDHTTLQRVLQREQFVHTKCIRLERQCDFDCF